MWLACGSGASGALGTGAADDEHALRRTLFDAAAALVTGGVHTVAWDRSTGDDRQPLHLAVCGAAEHGQLADAAPPSQAVVAAPVPLPLPLRVRKVALGWAHTAVLLDDGALLTCGSNADGQLGRQATRDGDCRRLERVPLLPPAVVDVACGGAHTVALARGDGGGVWAWGRNRGGLLAVGNPAPVQPLPARVVGIDAVAGSAASVRAVAAGWAFSAAVVGSTPSGGDSDSSGGSDDVLVTWGENRFGQCGRAPQLQADAEGAPSGGGGKPRRAACAAAVAPPGRVELPPPPPPGTAGPRRIAVACGWSHVAALVMTTPAAAAADTYGPATAAANVYTWGRCDMDQLGRPPAAAADAATTSAAVTATTAAPLPPLPPPRYDWRPAAVDLSDVGDVAVKHAPAGAFCPVEVACGSEHTVVRGGCGCVAAFGWNEHGNLGTGDRADRARPTLVDGVGCCATSADATRAADAIAAGGAVTFVRVAPNVGGDT